MVNLHDPVVSPQFALAFLRVWHVLAGIFIWEFVTTLDYEWRVFRGQLPRRWTIYVYSFARVMCLLGVITNFIGLNTTSAINCQAWISSVAVFLCLALASSTLLIVLRITAIWNGSSKLVMPAVVSVWAIGFGIHIQFVARLRSVWNPAAQSCLPTAVRTPTGLLGLAPTVFADLILVLIMLVGLIQLYRRGSNSFGLTPLILKQGCIWLFLCFISEFPEAVISLLSSNGQFVEIILTPGTIAMIIAATRMHRTLVDYAFGTRSTSGGRETLEMGSVPYSSPYSRSCPRSKPVGATSLSQGRIEVTVHKAFEQHPTSQKTDGGSDSPNTQTHEKPNVSWSLVDDLERGV